MEREAFLDAQLWLRKLSPDDPLLSLPVETAAPPPHGEEGRGGLCVLLPAAPPEQEGSSADAQPSSPPVPALSWCCFQLGSRYCFFRADEEDQDPTQLQIEILLARPPAPAPAPAEAANHLLLRFEKTLVYEVDPALLQAITLPKDRELGSKTGGHAAQESGRREPPPFGSMHCGGAVTLRVWMDPEHMPAEVAAHRLRLALCQVDFLRRQCHGRKKEWHTPLPSWKDTFRHNPDVSILSSVSSWTSLSKMSPGGFLEGMKAVLSASGDIEAVKMVIEKIVRARQQRSGHARDLSQSISQGEAYTPAVVVIDSESKSQDVGTSYSATARDALFSDMEIVVLVTELMHLFGEDHAGVNHLLGFSGTDDCTMCSKHDRCYKCASAEGALASCATSKWAAWDEFLERTDQVLLPSRKRKRSGDGLTSDEPPPRMDGRAQAAVDSFRRAIVERDDYVQWSRRHRHAKAQIRAMERTAFRALGMLPGRAEPDAGAWQGDRQVVEHTAQEQKLMMAEQVFAALLHKRRQLVCDELVLELLPRRM